MIKFFITILFFCVFLCESIAQTTISGSVYANNKPLEFVDVYANNTTLGAITNQDGSFELTLPDGNYELVVSILGYTTITYTLDTNTYKKSLRFILNEAEEQLETITIKTTVYDDDWYYNLGVFKKGFFGKSEFAENCTILNPKVLHFDYDDKTTKLNASASKLLEFKNENLGYTIYYDLQEFVVDKNAISYYGFARFEELKGSKRKQKKWRENRRIAYNGSIAHFYQSVILGTTSDEGYLIHQFIRKPNKERPTNAQIAEARKIIRKHRGKLDISASNTPQNKLDSAFITVRKARFPEYVDSIYKSNLEHSLIIDTDVDGVFLDFDDNLLVVYTKELEEEGFIKRSLFNTSREAAPQTSFIIPILRGSQIDAYGNLSNPLSVFYEGYWSYEKFSHALPLDYQMENKE